MVCMGKITEESKVINFLVTVAHAIGFIVTVKGISVPKNSINNQNQ